MAYYGPHHYGGYGGYGGFRGVGRWGFGRGHAWGHGWGHGGLHGRGWGHGPASRWPWLHADSQADALLPWAQSCLAQLFGPGVVQDGVLGPSTRQAIQQFQMQHQLPVTGMLDENTVAALQAACSGQAAGQDAGAPASPATPAPTGETGESEFQFEAAEPEESRRTGRWVRRNGNIVLLGV